MKTITLGVDVQVNPKAFKDLQKDLDGVLADLQALSKQDSLNKSLQNSTEQAKQLQQVLNGAWDSKLNQLDMSKFNTGLKSAGISAQNVKNILSGYPDVYEKFNRSVLEGNTHLKQTNKLLDKMAVTMANTVRFGISSSIFNNLKDSIQKAYEYTLKLDKSLNEIRIVSDASAEGMVRFAKYANESAKRLGSSTLDYTKGALIYYQQGLSEDEVLKRTDTTIKMSNVLGRSTEEVSNYMTAIWNNFADGTENLEYYGDVITALGAKTASSAEEIAGGLEKFAAIGRTIGLSYEYATSALTTITATTRQSEDTVGNALKTIFARIQGLKLGETLEDGTSLNKYSEALNRVGISIKDESGELKEMDTILNELGATWDTLTNAQKAALAQTVAGVRQYTQLIALMDNWGFFQENLNTAYSSTGTLAQQQNIYLDSLEAHLNQLQTEWEKTYDIIFNEEALKGFYDALTKILSGVNTWLTSLGGGMDTLLNIGTQLANVFSNQIGGEIARKVSNSAKSIEELLKQNILETTGDPQSKAYEKELSIAREIAKVKKALNDDEYQSLVKNMQGIGEYEDRLERINELKRKSQEDLASTDFDEFTIDRQNRLFEELRGGTATVKEYEYALKEVEDRIQHLPRETEEEIAELQKWQRIQKTLSTNMERAKEIQMAPEYEQQQKYLQGNVDLTLQQKEHQLAIQNIVKSTTGAMSILGATIGIVKTATNENLSAWEKFQAIAMGVVNVTTLVARNLDSFKNLKNSIQKILPGGATQSQTKATLDLAAANKIDEAAERADAKAKKANADASINATGSIKEQISKTLGGIGKDAKKTGTDFAKTTKSMTDNLDDVEMAAKSTGTVMSGAGAEVAESGIIAGGGLETMGAGAAGAGVSLGALAAAAAIAIAAIAALVGFIAWNVKEYNKDAEAAEKAAKAVTELQTQNTQLKESFNQLQDSWSAYQTAKDKLDELTKGTKEWKEALNETNDAALEIIKNVRNLDADTLRGLYQRDKKTGELVINEKSMQDILDAQASSVRASDMAVATAELQSLQASNNSRLVATTRRGNFATTSQYMKGGLAGWNTAYLTGAAYGAWKTQDNAAVEARDVIIENLDLFEKSSTLGEFEAKLEDLGIETEKLSDTYLVELQQSVESMAVESAAASEKLKLIASLKVDEQLGDEYGIAEKAIASQSILNEQNRIYNRIMRQQAEEMKKNSGAGNEYYQALAVRYSAATEGKYRAATGNTVQGTDANRTLIFEDATTGQKTENISISAVANTIAAYEAMNQMGKTAEIASKSFEKLEKNLSQEFGEEIGQQMTESIKQFIADGNFDTLSEVQFQQLRTLSSEDLMRMFGIDPNSFTAIQDLNNALGGEKNLGSFKKYEQSLEDYESALEDFLNKLNINVQNAYNSLGNIGELNLASKKAIARSLQDALIDGGQESVDALVKFYNGLSKEDLGAFSQVTSSITDWSKVNVADLTKSLQDAGVTTELTEEQLSEYIDVMRRASDATSEFNSLAEAYADVMKIAAELQFGDTISAEDYAKLGDSAEEYFTRMLDGTYKLTKDASDFYNTIKTNQIETFRNSLEDQRRNLDTLRTAQQGNFDTGTLSQNQGDNTEGIKQQLALLELLGNRDQKEQALGWDSELEKTGTTDTEAIAEAIGKLSKEYDNLDEAIKTASDTYRQDWLALLTSARDLDELRGLTDFTDQDSVAAYTEAYKQLREAQRMEDIDVDEMEDYADYLRQISKDSKELSEDLEENEEGSEDLAIQIMRMNKGVETLGANWENWSDILKHSSKESEEYYEAISQARDAMSDLLDIDEEFISADFITENLEDIGRAAEGNAEAINRLRQAALKDIVLNMELNDDALLKGDALWAEVQGLQNMLDAMGPLEAGAIIDTSGLDAGEADFIGTLNSLILAAGMSADQVNAMLAGMGFQANFAKEPQKVQIKEPDQVTTHHSIQNKQVTTMEDGSTAVEWDDVTTTTTVPGKVHDGEVDAYSMETSAPGTTVVPKIASVQKMAKGSSNNYSSKNKGGSKSPSGSGKKGGGGKKGGSGSSSKPKKIEKTEDEVDRYHKVNTQIEKVSNNLNKLENAEEKALGGDWIKNLTQQFRELNNQIANYNEKLKIAKGEQSELRKQLAKQGVKFNTDGTISNYTAAFNAQLAALNKLENQYNKLSASQQEKWDENKIIDNAKDRFNEFKENMNRYDELVSSFIPDIEKQIQDAIDEIVEKQIERFDKGIDLRLDMAEAERDWNEFKTKVIDSIDEDDIIGQTQAKINDFATYYDTSVAGSIVGLTKHLNDIMAEMNKKVSNVYGKDDVKELEDLRKYYEDLMDEMEGVFDLQKEIHEAYLDMMDEAQDKFDEQIEAYETVSDLIEHDMNLIELVYGESAYTELGKFYDKQAENNKNQLDFQRQQVEFWKAQMDGAEEASDEWENAKEKWVAATADLNDLIEDAIENLQNKYLNAIEGIFQKLNDEVTKGKGLDYVDTEWQLINKNADQYLDTINQLFATQALENKYLDAIDQTDNVSAQRQLKELMDEELAALREKDKLTQYDIERANKRYEIALKQIALEEAQQNKSTMRLRRDSQGNYRYEYVADNDAVDQARDELEKLKNDLYNFDKEQYQESLNEMYDTWVEYQDALKEAAQINDPEERAAKEALIKEKYGDIINNMLAENDVIRQNLEQSAFEDLALLYDKNLEDYTNMTEAEKDALMNDLVPTWQSGIQDMIDTMIGEGGFYPVCDEAFTALEQEQDELSEGFKEIEDTANQTFDSIAEGVDSAIDETKQLIADNNDLTTSYQERLDVMKGLGDQIDSLADSFKKASDAAENTIKKVHDLLHEMDLETAAAYDKDATAATKDKTAVNAINGTTQATTVKTTASTASTTSTTAKKSSSSSSSNAYSGYRLGGKKYTIKSGDTLSGIAKRYYGSAALYTEIWNHNKGHLRGKNANQIWPGEILYLNTGGYTGDWSGNGGRIAMLHQKELVLNAQDTENMLNAINVMRNLTNSVGIATLARLASLGASGSAGIGGNGLEQNVHISATFPNATSTREIEDALLNLTNRASQMVGRR